MLELQTRNFVFFLSSLLLKSSLVFLSSLFADMDDVTISNLPEEVLVELVLLRSSDHESVRSFLCTSKSNGQLGQHAAFGLYHAAARIIQEQVREHFRCLRIKRCPLLFNPASNYESIFEDCPPSVRSTFLKSLGYPLRPSPRSLRNFETIMRARFKSRQRNGSWVVPTLK